MADLKLIYKADTENLALEAMDALFKMLYLAMMDVTKKWTGKSWDWGQTLDQLCIYFGERIRPEDID